MRRSATGSGPRRPSPETLASWAISLALTACTFAQAPGEVIPETKLDITLDPVRYLGRALAAWDPSAGFGRIQNQSVGYLFPMGPFFALGDALGLSPWVTQRLWLGVVLALTAWGTVRLMEALRPQYRRVAETRPELVALLRQVGREREVPAGY